ncbi:MAG: Ig-like domain-containing protein [Bacteroidaceae bacterium]|nr:Ig-like domain-containing protein [Bacteroidaceae bacterium]
MKRSYISLATYSLLLLVSCTNESEVIQSVKESPKTFYATTESYNPQTKTSLNLSGNVLWKTGDQVSIFNVSTINQQYQVTDQSDGKTSASLYQVTPPGFVAGTDLPTNIAYYPYSASNEIAKNGSNYEITVSLPSTQNYAENSFGNGSFPMAAVTEDESDMNLKFKNVLGGLKLQLTGTDVISRIVVSGNNNEILCGDATVTASNTTTPTIVLSDDTKTAVTLDCGSGVQLNSQTPTLFIIALPPMIMTGGFTIDIYNTENGTQQIKSTRSQTITRSALLAMPTVAVAYEPVVPYEYVDLGLSVNWATFNVGATAPEEYGDYYAWGETAPKATYSSSTYKYMYDYNLTKYCSKSDYGNNGYVDDKTILDPEDDVAHVKWGGDWRMPTYNEWSELLNVNNCTTIWTTMNGIQGFKFTSKKSGYENRSIFLPAAELLPNYQNHVGSGFYWSSSLSKEYGTSPESARIIFFSSDDQYNVYGSNTFRTNGLPVRPVCPSETWINNISVTLNKSELSLLINDSETLVATIKEGSNTIKNYFTVTWSSSNTSVATVDEKGVVSAVSEGDAAITASFNGKTSTCNVTVINYDYVDLGLSVKWATFNVGATAPEEFGDYFAWGETEPYYLAGYANENPQTHWKQGYSDGYKWTTYKYCNNDENKLTKYCSQYEYGNNGFTDALTVLDPEDDAAHVNWGGNWRMPTKAEFEELLTYCYFELITKNGVKGWKVTSRYNSSRYIFLPLAGCRNTNGLGFVGTYGCYWSSSLKTDNPDYAWYLFCEPEFYQYTSLDYRFNGISVRPVCP